MQKDLRHPRASHSMPPGIVPMRRGDKTLNIATVYKQIMADLHALTQTSPLKDIGDMADSKHATAELSEAISEYAHLAVIAALATAGQNRRFFSGAEQLEEPLKDAQTALAQKLRECSGYEENKAHEAMDGIDAILDNYLTPLCVQKATRSL